MSLHGGCMCGTVRYEISAPPLFVHACHCRDCQRFSGSAFVVLMGVPLDTFALTGEVTRVTNPTPSGAGYDAYQCPRCATLIWNKYHFVGAPLLAVRGGTLDDPSQAPPAYHIFTRSKQPWLTLPAEAIRFDGWLDPATAWPPATIERLRALGLGI